MTAIIIALWGIGIILVIIVMMLSDIIKEIRKLPYMIEKWQGTQKKKLLTSSNEEEVV